jgi:broad specificity phosphatase PhoE
MKLYFVRHGKTQWNLEKRLQGQKGDSPLLAESYEAIARVNKKLSQIVQFDKVISSPSREQLRQQNY